MNWRLADAEGRAAENPTFEIPALKARHALRVGDGAKLVFELLEPPGEGVPVSRRATGERMWVEIVKVEHGASDGVRRVRYTGVLRSHPVVVDAERGQEVEFGPEHVADFDRPWGAEGYRAEAWRTDSTGAGARCRSGRAAGTANMTGRPRTSAARPSWRSSSAGGAGW